MKITTMQEYNKSENKIKCLIFGLPGTGKTYSAKTLPEELKKNTLIISGEDGLMTIADQDFRIAKINTWSDFQEVYRMLKTNQIPDITTLFIDGMTEINAKLVDSILTNSGKTKMTFDEYSENLMKMRKATKLFLNLPYHIFMNALAKEDKDEILQTNIVRPRLTGSIREEFPAYFDFVLYSFAHNQNYYFATKSSLRVLCKDRTGLLPNPMPNDLSIVWEAYKLKVIENMPKEEAIKALATKFGLTY